jgi:hypothetical protein
MVVLNIPLPWQENSSMMRSTYLMVRLIAHNHFILQSSRFYTLILVFNDATFNRYLVQSPYSGSLTQDITVDYPHYYYYYYYYSNIPMWAG